MLVSEIRSGFGTIGCTFESRDWQNVALDIRSADGMDGLLCHEIWHATENHILSADYSAFDPEAWAALNPESFTYYETFLWNENDRWQWTLYSGGNIFCGWVCPVQCKGRSGTHHGIFHDP